MEPILALLLPLGLMWLLLIRPQQRRMRQHQAVIASLSVGDEVITAGGIMGTVTRVDDDAMQLEVAPGVELKVLRAAVSQKVGPPGEYDDFDDDAEVDDADFDDELTDDELERELGSASDVDVAGTNGSAGSGGLPGSSTPAGGGSDPGSTGGRTEPRAGDDDR